MANAPETDNLDELATVRDWLRFGASRFSAAGLVFGHGTSTAVDEAAFLILKTLHLPIDELEPWLDARLTRAERLDVAQIIDKRIATRLPAPYLVNEAWIQGHSFYVDQRAFVPRSYIGELIGKRIGAPGDAPYLGADLPQVRNVLDLCTGSGCLAILAALAFADARVDAADVSSEALAVARRNVADYGLEDRVRLVQSDLFQSLGGRRYDLIVTNPPYVGREAMSRFPPEYRAEPALAHAGGKDGLDIVRRILAAAHGHLTRDGLLVAEIGMGRALLEAEFPGLPFLWLDTEESEGEVFALEASALERAGLVRISD
jgi:ribosomal protein L3 glutamine methyltransferase